MFRLSRQDMVSIILRREQCQNPGRKKNSKKKTQKSVSPVNNFETKLCNQYRMIMQPLAFEGKGTQA